MLQQPDPVDFVVGSGKVYSVRDLVEFAFSCFGVQIVWVRNGARETGCCRSSGEVLVETDERYMRPNEVTFLKSNSGRIREALGWEPKVCFHSMIKGMVEEDIACERSFRNAFPTQG
jgi:GDPmannose 4,6-dehydratase